MEDRTCFVIMPTGGPYDIMYEDAVVPAAGSMRCVHFNELDRQGGHRLENIVRRITEAEVVIVDLTDGNAQFLYELGLAHGLFKNVIVLTQSKEDLPFDLKDYPVIDYLTALRGEKVLRENLEKCFADLHGFCEESSPVRTFIKEPDRPVPAARFRELQEKCEEMERRLRERDKDVASLENTQSELSRMRQRVEETERTLAEAQTALDNCKSARKVFEEKVADYQKQHQQWEAEREPLRRENERLQGFAEYAERMLSDIIGQSAKSMSIDDKTARIKQIYDQVERNGEVVIKVPKKERRFIFEEC